uniref:Isoprenylcysteine carboxyl methyltransferase n=1 Tax=uncultured Thiotrichaceae bacterium TaxID=298394 RepID=A0A6S6T5T3_9GAMM|nr:MAG: Isoprenylcysteine carboxyl methyltransferase [uncultured Thiotrichaceae bacterium]
MLKTVIPPPIYVLSAAGIMWWLDKSLPVMVWLDSSLNQIGLVIIAIAVLLDLWSLGLFFRSKTTPNPMKPSGTSTLVFDGMYKITRNPMYLGMLIALAGWWIYLGSLSPLLMLPVFVWVLTIQQIIPEETVLEDKFGQEYLDYKRRVRRWI